MKLTKQRLKEIIKEEIHNINEASKYDEVKANMEKTMGLLVRKMGLKSAGRHLVGKGGMSSFWMTPKKQKNYRSIYKQKLKMLD